MKTSTPLDEVQAKAVNTRATRVLVTAVPGSGKTRVLTERLRFMVHDLHFLPSNVVAITFTRMAAKEIRKRLAEDARGMYVGTLHAFALRLIMEIGAILGYEKDWLTIIPDEDAALDQREVLEDFGLIRKKKTGGYDWIKVGARAWESFVDSMFAGNPPDRDKQPEFIQLYEVWEAYLNRLRSQNVLTFGTILTECFRLLSDRKALAYFRKQYRHFVIDEAQDTSHLQWSIVWRLVDKANPDTLFVVGDDDQSLYAWRGAVPDELVKMEGQSSAVFKLENCYRFGPSIAAPSQRLIENNVVRVKKEIRVSMSTPGSFSVMRDASPVEFLAAVSETTGPVAILARTHAILEACADCLEFGGVEFTRVGRLRRLQASSEFRAIMGYMRLAGNPQDRRAFMAITATEGLDDTAIRALRERALATGEALSKVYGVLPGSTDAIFNHVRQKDPSGLYGEAIDYLKTLAYYEGLSGPREIVNFLALADVQDEVQQATGRVILATVHGAKGLEWETVFLVGLNEGVMPKHAKPGPEMEEERRICYVGMTRARARLVVVHINPASFDVRAGAVESRFLAEMGVSGPNVPRGTFARS